MALRTVCIHATGQRPGPSVPLAFACSSVAVMQTPDRQDRAAAHGVAARKGTASACRPCRRRRWRCRPAHHQLGPLNTSALPAGPEWLLSGVCALPADPHPAPTHQPAAHVGAAAAAAGKCSPLAPLSKPPTSPLTPPRRFPAPLQVSHKCHCMRGIAVRHDAAAAAASLALEHPISGSEKQWRLARFRGRAGHGAAEGPTAAGCPD